MVFWWVCVPVPFYMFCPSFRYQSTLSGSVSKRQVVLFLEGSALCPSTSHHCPLGAPSHVNRSRVASHLALLSCLNVSEFPGDIPASLSLWTPHSLCKHVYTLLRALCTFRGVCISGWRATAHGADHRNVRLRLWARVSARAPIHTIAFWDRMTQLLCLSVNMKKEILSVVSVTLILH